MTSFVNYHTKTVSRMMASSPQATIRALQDGPCHFLWVMAAFAAEESGLEGAASSMVYARDFETEVFFFQIEQNGQNVCQRRFVYDNADFAIRCEREPEGPTTYFPVEGKGLTTERREEIMASIRELCESQITFLCPSGEPVTERSPRTK